MGEAIISRRSVKKSASGAENNGRSWKTSNLTGITVNSVLGDNGKWVATTQDNGVFYSTDGKNWTQSKLTSGSFGAVCCREGNWVVGSLDDAGIFYTSNLNSWSAAYPKKGSFKPGSICGFENGWYAGPSTGLTVYYSSSTSGSTWSGSNSSYGGVNQIHASINCCMVACGAENATSDSYGVYYRYSAYNAFSSSNTKVPMRCVSRMGNIWLAGSEENAGIYYSASGLSSLSQSDKTDGSISSIFCANEIIVATSDSGTPGIFYSTNGSNWSDTGVVTTGAKTIKNACGVWVCGTCEGILFSLDGINWSRTNISDKEITSLCNSNGLWVAAGPDGIYYSELV